MNKYEVINSLGSKLTIKADFLKEYDGSVNFYINATKHDPDEIVGVFTNVVSVKKIQKEQEQ